MKTREPVSNRQRNQLAFISEFCTDVAYVPGLNNVVADTLTRQYDSAAIVNTIAHTMNDIDLESLASEQEFPNTETSLHIRPVQFQGISARVLCDVSTGRPRVLVPRPEEKESSRQCIRWHTLLAGQRFCPWQKPMCGRTWTGMWKSGPESANKCKSKVVRHVKPPIKTISVPKDRFQHVHVDLVGPLPIAQGNQYLLTMLDRTTRWAEAAAWPQKCT